MNCLRKTESLKNFPFSESEVFVIFDWLTDLVGGVGDMVGSVVSSAGEMLSQTILDSMFKFKDKASNECIIIVEDGTKDYDEFVIDKVTPEVVLSYDNNNGKGIYYNNSRTAKIVVSDNNFKGTADMIDISAVDKTGEVKLPKIEWIDNICEISFEEDAHYRMKFTDTFRDRAGNKCKVALEENTENAYNFVIDQTSPEILLSYDNNDCGEAGYYKDFRKATITVEDDNFTGTADMVKVVAKDSEKQEGKGSVDGDERAAGNEQVMTSAIRSTARQDKATEGLALAFGLALCAYYGVITLSEMNQKRHG